jgi:hypothetical protein
MEGQKFLKKGNIYWRDTLLTLLFASSFFMATAQDQDYVRSGLPPNISDEPKFSIGVSIGPAIPMLDFGSTNVKGSFWDFNSTDSTRLQGFAKTGFHFDINASYMFSPDFGIAVMLGGNSNPIDVNAFSNSMGYQSTSTTTNYYTGEYFIGPCFSFSLSKKLKIKASALIGLVGNNYPTFTLNFNDTITYSRTISAGKYAFGYCVSGSLVYSINDNVDFLVNTSYTYAKITYPSWSETEVETITFPTYTLIGTAYLNHPNCITTMVTGILKPTIGIAFKF